MKKHVKLSVDIAMIVLLPPIKAYSLIGEAFHEAAGCIMFVLFVIHNCIHRKWWAALTKGKYKPYRIFITAVNILLAVLMLAQPISGILISRSFFKFVHISGTAAKARAIHLLLAYWCYVIMSVHLGLHVEPICKSATKNRKKSKRAAAITKILIAFVSAYGVYAFIQRGFPGYMFMKTRFAFFDTGEPRILFFIDYIAIMILFSAAGHCIGHLLKHDKGK